MNFLERALDKTNHFGNYVWMLVIIFGTGLMIGIPISIVKRMQESNGFISQNIDVLLMLIPFAVILFACIWCVKHLHSRTFSETVNGTKKVRWGRAFMGFGVWFLLMLIYLLVDVAINPDNFTFQFDIKSFLPLLLIALFFIPLQATSEEFLFRGYLAQGIAVLTKNRWLVVIIPGILFGLVHFANPEISEYGFWVVMPDYIIIGLLFGLISVLDDGIELLIGMHAANNICGCLFVTFDADVLSSPALFYQHELSIGVDTISMTVAGIIAIIFFARKYKWDFRVMNKKVEPLPIVEVRSEIE